MANGHVGVVAVAVGVPTVAVEETMGDRSTLKVVDDISDKDTWKSPECEGVMFGIKKVVGCAATFGSANCQRQTREGCKR